MTAEEEIDAFDDNLRGVISAALDHIHHDYIIVSLEKTKFALLMSLRSANKKLNGKKVGAELTDE